MASTNSDLYAKFFKNYVEASTLKDYGQIRKDAAALWKKIKEASNFPENVESEIFKLKKKKDFRSSSITRFLVVAA